MIRKHFDKLFLLTPLLLLQSNLQAQGLYINSGGYVVMSGASSLVITDGDFNNSGTFTPSTGTLKFSGSSTSGQINGFTTLYNLTVDEAATNLLLNSNVAVTNNVTFNNGNIDLNTFDLDLGTTGMLMNENETSRITGLAGGRVLRTENLNAPLSVNPGNIGIEITTDSNMGTTQIARGHVPQTGTTSGEGIERYFDIIAPNDGNLSATLVFHYLDAELNGITEFDLGMSQKPISAWYWEYLGVDNLDQVNNELTKQNIDSLNRVTLSSSLSNTLPLTLVSFAGQLINRQTHLKWSVADESGIQKYDVERSADGKTFKKLGSVNASGMSEYSFIDKEPFSGNTYYRLRVYEQSKNALSQVVKVNMGQQATVSVYPNPVTDNVHVEFYSQAERSVTFKVLDVHGKLVSEQKIQAAAGHNKLDWDLSSFAAGTYYLQLDELQTETVKLTKL